MMVLVAFIAEQVQREVNDVDMDLFLVAYVSDFIACMCYVLSGVMTARHAFTSDAVNQCLHTFQRVQR